MALFFNSLLIGAFIHVYLLFMFIMIKHIYVSVHIHGVICPCSSAINVQLLLYYADTHHFTMTMLLEFMKKFWLAKLNGRKRLMELQSKIKCS